MIFRNLPAVLVGILVGMYWLRVVHLARKIRRRTGHTANVVPPGRVGMITRFVWFPVVFLWIAIPLSTALPWSPAWVMRPLIASPALSWSALAVAVVAFVLTLICWKKMGTSWRMGIDPGEKNPLIVTGPFAYVRHPIYALSSVLMLATAAAAAFAVDAGGCDCAPGVAAIGSSARGEISFRHTWFGVCRVLQDHRAIHSALWTVRYKRLIPFGTRFAQAARYRDCALDLFMTCCPTCRQG